MSCIDDKHKMKGHVCMYVCGVCLCLYVCLFCSLSLSHWGPARKAKLMEFVCVRVCVCLCMSVRVCMRVSAFVCAWVNLCLLVCLCLFVCMCVHACVSRSYNRQAGM